MATAHSVVGFATCACLLVFYAVGEPFGVINDLGNALLGALSLWLAWLLRPPATAAARSPLSDLLLCVAGAGAALTATGTVLVLTGITGFYLAGLWSSLGFALIGAWLVGVGRHTPSGGRSGLIAGLVMLLGLVGLPGIVMGLDDLDKAPAWTFVAGVNWAGTYLLFPAWSSRLAREDRPERLR
ncbi:hypothetical protein GCM10009742_56110 [Kribbella karoonensis]|uniref:Uncharacterized protein n=1 Tax=Kribbella karoonensis TaxID=324851 RepID=A0ABN2E9P1_9ACTN